MPGGTLAIVSRALDAPDLRSGLVQVSLGCTVVTTDAERFQRMNEAFYRGEQADYIFTRFAVLMAFATDTAAVTRSATTPARRWFRRSDRRPDGL